MICKVQAVIVREKDAPISLEAIPVPEGCEKMQHEGQVLRSVVEL